MVGVLVAGLSVAGLKVYGAFKDRDALIEERKGVLAEMTHDLAIAQMKAENERVFREAAEADKLRQELLYRDTLVIQGQIREEIKAQRQIFKQHDVTKLVNAKPEALKRLSNAATKRKLDELESVYND